MLLLILVLTLLLLFKLFCPLLPRPVTCHWSSVCRMPPCCGARCGHDGPIIRTPLLPLLAS